MVVAKIQADEIIEYLREYHVKHGYAPSVREVAEHLGAGVSTTHRHLRALIATREVTAQTGRSRTWRPSELPLGADTRRSPA